MSAIKTYYMRCDGCGFTDDNIDSPTAAGARRTARSEGWTHPRKHCMPNTMFIDLCAACGNETAVAS